jgi:hypothetical protein
MILNKAEREIPTMERIRGWIDYLESGHRTMIVDFHEPDLYERLLDFSPEVILTFPFTAIPLSEPFLLLKRLLGCLVVCLRAEGVVNFDSRQQIEWMAGMDRYPDTLVDYEIAWGPRTAEVLRDILTGQGKISDPSRVVAMGHAGLEPQFEGDEAWEGKIPEPLLSRMVAAGRRNVVFIITGFQLAEYTPRDIMGAGDFLRPDDPEFPRKFEEACQGVQRAQRFRTAWAEMVLRTAEANPQALIVVKSHPIEAIFNDLHKRPNPYQVLERAPNVVHTFENIPVGAILRHCGLFLHYGSTCAIESFLQRVPSVFVSSREIYGDRPADAYTFSDLGWPSAHRCDLEDVPALATRHFASPLAAAEEGTEMAKVLSDSFNIRSEHVLGNEPYQPSKEIARFLLDLDGICPQYIPDEDPYFRFAVAKWSARLAEHCLRRTGVGPFASRCALSRLELLCAWTGSPSDHARAILEESMREWLSLMPPTPAGQKLVQEFRHFRGRYDRIASAIAALVPEGRLELAEGLCGLLQTEDPEAASLVRSALDGRGSIAHVG